MATKPAALSGCLEEDSRACVRTRPASMKKKGTWTSAALKAVVKVVGSRHAKVATHVRQQVDGALVELC